MKNEIEEFIKSIRKPISYKQIMILRLKFDKQVLEKCRWWQFGRKIRTIKDILDALNYLTKEEEKFEISGPTGYDGVYKKSDANISK